jgi:hypothetical protein
MRLNIFRYEVPPVKDGDTEFPEHVHLTELGLAVLKECLSPISAKSEVDQEYRDKTAQP